MISFDYIDRRVMAAVERVAASDPNPGDPFRGLYISDETALRLTRGESATSADERLDDGDRARSGSICSTRPCWPSARRPSSTRATAGCTRTCRTTSRASSPSPRLVGHLLEGEGVTAADVMGAFDRNGPLRARGALRLLGDAQTPLAERPIKVADRLAGFLLGAPIDELPPPPRLRLVDTPGRTIPDGKPPWGP